MVQLSYTTYISVDLAHQKIFRAKVGKDGTIHAKVGKGGIKYTAFVAKACGLSPRSGR